MGLGWQLKEFRRESLWRQTPNSLYHYGDQGRAPDQKLELFFMMSKK
jgi:hypothetical protein